MNKAGLPKAFIADAVETAFKFEGVSDLVKMWDEEPDETERAEIVADIQDLIVDSSQKDHVKAAFIRFDDLDAIAKDVRRFKDLLRLKVDQAGGIGRLAELTGIPQPSLSRFFNSAAMPRRATLFKIASALGLSQVEIAAEWASQGTATDASWNQAAPSRFTGGVTRSGNPAAPIRKSVPGSSLMRSFAM